MKADLVVARGPLRIHVDGEGDWPTAPRCVGIIRISVLTDDQAVLSPDLDPLATDLEHGCSHTRRTTAATHLDDIAREAALPVGRTLDDRPPRVDVPHHERPSFLRAGLRLGVVSRTTSVTGISLETGS